MNFEQRLKLLEDARKAANNGVWEKDNSNPNEPLIIKVGEINLMQFSFSEPSVDFTCLAANHIQRLIDDARKMREFVDMMRMSPSEPVREFVGKLIFELDKE